MNKQTAAVVFLFFFSIFLWAGAAQAAEVPRFGGQDRFEVAVNVSKEGWPEGSGTVVVANYLAFADALAATPLAYQKDGPILLTQSGQLTAATREEIVRLKAKQAIIVGGTASVSDTVSAELKKLGLAVQRLGGKDRFEVAYRVSQEMADSEAAVIAYGLVFSDALSIAPYAAQHGYPILLTTKDRLPSATQQALTEKAVTRTIISGGEGSVGPAVASLLPQPERIGGKDRFEVSVNIVKQLEMSTEKAYMATGLTFADALTGSVLAAKNNAPILLTWPNRLPDTTRSLIQEKGISDFSIFGGTASVQEDILNKFASALTIDNTHGIEGYTDKPSYFPGETISFKIHTSQPAYGMDLIRFGKEEQTVHSVPSLAGMKQNYQKYDFREGTDWKTTFSYKVPADWKSRLYGARVHDGSGNEFYIIFVVKNASASKPKLAVLANTFTWEAYNTWGGASFYRYSVDDGSGKRTSEIISMNRPNPSANPYEGTVHLPFEEKLLLAWLEQNNYAYDVITEYDLHKQPSLLKSYKTLVLNSHSEYWSKPMHDGFLSFVNNGGNVLNLSANSLYWKVAVKDKQIEVRKDYSRHTFVNEPGGLWRNLSRPESRYLGVAYTRSGYGTFKPYKVTNAGHWIFKNTGLRNGDLIGSAGVGNQSASGWETDKRTGYTPSNTVLLAKGTNPDNGGAEMVYYDTPSGGGVFSAGSLTFTGSLAEDVKLAQVVKNVLGRFAVN